MFPKPVLQLAELVGCNNRRIARMRQVDSENGFDPPRPSRHHHDAIRKLHGFIDIMGDKDNSVCLSLSRLLMSCSPRMIRVCSSSAPKGSSIRRILGSITRARAMATPLLHAAGQLRRVAVFKSP